MAKSGENKRLSRRLADMATLLGQIREQYDELFSVLDAKIAAMRKADWNALAAFNERGKAISRRIAERDGLRRQLLDAIGLDLGMAPRTGRTLNMTQLIERIPSKYQHVAPGLRAAAESLLPALTKAAQANRVAGYIARGVVDHLRWVFEAVMPRCEGGGEYRGDGAAAMRSGPLMMDTLG